MTDTTVTRAQLSEAVYQEVGLSRNESADLVESVLREVSEADVGSNVVIVFKAVRPGALTLSYALTRGETTKALEARTFTVRIR